MMGTLGRFARKIVRPTSSAYTCNTWLRSTDWKLMVPAGINCSFGAGGALGAAAGVAAAVGVLVATGPVVPGAGRGAVGSAGGVCAHRAELAKSRASRVVFTVVEWFGLRV